MDLITNRFAVLDMDSDSDSKSEVMHPPSPSNTPPYPPYISGTTPPPSSPLLLEEKSEDNRFKFLHTDGFTPVFSRERNTLIVPSRPVKTIQFRSKFLNISSNVDFPRLATFVPKHSTGIWGESFAKKVASLADREAQAAEQTRKEEEDEKEKNRLDVMPISSRFRRTLEDILTDEGNNNISFSSDVLEPVDEEFDMYTEEEDR